MSGLLLVQLQATMPRANKRKRSLKDEQQELIAKKRPKKIDVEDESAGMEQEEVATVSTAEEVTLDEQSENEVDEDSRHSAAKKRKV